MTHKKLLYNLNKFLSFVLRCRVYIGIRPKDISAPVIIFFPILQNQLNCGFAGLMTCHPQKDAATNADLNIAELWKKIKTAKTKPDCYLNDIETVLALNTAVAELKREDMQEFLFYRADRADTLRGIVQEMKQFITDEENRLEEQLLLIDSAKMETINKCILMLKDICWALEKDILSNLQKILALAGAKNNAGINPGAFKKYRKLNLLLNALDRLEVRGRDSAGIQLTFSIKDKKQARGIIDKIKENNLFEDYQRRTQKNDLINSSISVSPDQDSSPNNSSITFTYKTFSIVGELGRNVAELRNFIGHDKILRIYADTETYCETALTHTRWASVGAITEENCHPLNNYYPGNSPSSSYPSYPGAQAQINVVLNGDIDNYTALKQSFDAQEVLIAPQVTTDTKIIPLQIEKYLKIGKNLAEAFLLAVNDFEGSHAIVMSSNLEPGKMFLALKGSGQSIYVGIAADQYMFSSELYGLVEVTPRFLNMSGERGGQIFILDQASGGTGGVSASFYDGTPIHLKDDALQEAEITTRDIDRGSYPHYFLKEISESSPSIKRTLRGKYRISPDGKNSAKVTFNMGADIIPADVRLGLKNGAIKNIVIIGHGTAAVAGKSVAEALKRYLEGASLNIWACVASELSGFGLKDDLSDTLIIPITQSGTTTDTNRSVAMAGERGARIIAIVNRRQSDITAKAHGVFYTSDGRDIEMSVASTKAFYAQIVAGQVLALFFAQLLKTKTDDIIAAELHNLESAPRLMDQLFATRDAIANSVKNAASKKYWAVVGSGPNKVAADEIRVKLSELCYKTISSDIVENKKHIDLSAEPLILACVSGNPQNVIEDVAKDVAIFKAHKASVIVFADEGDHRFDKIADSVIYIPAAPSPLPVILNTMAGHLWGYYAARAIDEEAQAFREFRGRLTRELAQRAQNKLSLFETIADLSLRGVVNDFYLLFNSRRQNGAFGGMGSKTIADLILLLKYAAGKLPLQEINQDFPGEKEIFSPYELLDATLGAAIDELTRPIDAIRHQAKTVTVGTSRKEKEIEGIIFDLLKNINFTMKNLPYREIMTINRIQPAIEIIKGYTLYKVNNLDEQGNPANDSTIVVCAKGGVAASMKSRADNPTALMGVKRTIVSTGHVYLGRGKTDNAPIMIIPLRGEKITASNMLLIHVQFNESLKLADKIASLGYLYNDIRNLIDEYNLRWNDRYLEDIPLESLFSEPIEAIVGLIKSRFSL
ncbi:MAG: SIS domain-containing protein [Syntrophaceae bacterium]|nr:SIS domain-containing protein [Syntrophaceae bacterium]